MHERQYSFLFLEYYAIGVSIWPFHAIIVERCKFYSIMKLYRKAGRKKPIGESKFRKRTANRTDWGVGIFV